MLRRPLLVLVVGAGFVAASLLTAAPASAATLTDNGDGSVTVSGVAGFGNNVYFCTGSPSAAACWNTPPGPVLANYFVDDGTQNRTYWAGSNVETFPAGVATTLPAGTYRVILNNGGAVATSVLVALTSNPGGSSSSSSAGSGPAAVVQQFARPASGTCDAAQPAGLNWSGVASGGWSESWAQWVNGGTGGAICTRTLSYSSGAWRVG